MDIPILLDQVHRKWEMLLQAWNIYLLVSVALLVFVIVVPSVRSDRRVLRLLGVGYLFFAWTHILGLLYILKQWAALSTELRMKLESQAGGIAMIDRLAAAGIVDSPEAFWVVPFHLLADGFVLFALWAVSKQCMASPRSTS